MSATTATGPYLTVAQAATRLGLPESTVYKLLSGGKIGHYRHGETYRLPESEVAAYLARTYVPAKTDEAAA